MSKDVFNRHDPFDERFDRQFDRIDRVFEKAVESPGKSMMKVVLAAIAVNVVYFFIVCGIIAFFIWLLFL